MGYGYDDSGDTTFSFTLNGYSLGTSTYSGTYDCACTPIEESCKHLTFEIPLVENEVFNFYSTNNLELSVVSGSACLRNVEVWVHHSN